MSCEVFIEPCAGRGDCVVNEITNLSSCICSDPFSNQIEFNFMIEGDIEARIEACTYHDTWLYALYALGAIFASFAVFQQLYNCQKGGITGSALRGITFFSLGLGLFASVVRLLNRESALFGEDILFSFLIANLYSIVAVVTQLFLARYMKYLRLKLIQGNTVEVLGIKLYIKFANRIIILDLILFQLFGLVAIVEKQSRKTIFLLADLYLFLKICFVWFCTYRFLGQHVTNMKLLMVKASPAKQNDSAGTSTGAAI
eukprot:CAMPEP_0184073086 /NCGR_PEP_ID=MMETSP0957-20130417/62675_1 /TAXON_ID=627963 /ORGANISM="Aplanochytrium sp, Strain PBS07" /LENGTH=256 /DNA_ID=CAMNT_0026374499 /DNA_START=29 /DNA_END=796 /DNA_ORIENTATION=-